jgi:hypothetical protein
VKKLIYKVEGYTSVYNPETKKVEERLSLAEAIIENPSEEDLARAVEIAYNGEYTVEDDGIEEMAQPTQEERISELEEAMKLLLSEVNDDADTE